MTNYTPQVKQNNNDKVLFFFLIIIIVAYLGFNTRICIWK